MFKSDFMPYKIVPVNGYDDIRVCNEEFLCTDGGGSSSEIRSVIMLDCGGSVDLSDFFTTINPHVSIYLLDSHRPYTLFNIFNNPQLHILDDGFIEDNFEHLKDAWTACKLVDPSMSEMHSDAGDLSEEELERCHQKYKEYHQDGTWHGSSCSRLVLDLTDLLGRSSNDYLWLTILSITAQQIREESSSVSYEADVVELRERCLMMNRHSATAGTSTTTSSTNSTIDISDRDGRISFEPEFRFMLMKHWTLFQSMLNSRYVATRLGVWRERGKRLLETFLVKLGIPLAQSKGEWCLMDGDLKDSLPFRIGKHAAAFGLHDLLFPSFQREYGYMMKVSSCDVVYAIMAILESPCRLDGGGGNRNHNTSPVWRSNFYYALDALDHGSVGAAATSAAKGFSNNSAGSMDKLKIGIQLAMRQQQIILQQASAILSHRLIKQGKRFRYVVLKKGGISGGGGGGISGGGGGDGGDLAQLSGNPSSLDKLALFLVDSCRQARNGHLPLVLAALQPPTPDAPTFSKYLVVTSIPNSLQAEDEDEDGYSNDNDNGSISDDDIPLNRNVRTARGKSDNRHRFVPIHNRFGIAFRDAAIKVNARVKHDGFESSLIEVRAEDLRSFLQILQTIPL